MRVAYLFLALYMSRFLHEHPWWSKASFYIVEKFLPDLIIDSSGGSGRMPVWRDDWDWYDNDNDDGRNELPYTLTRRRRRLTGTYNWVVMANDLNKFR